MRILHVSSEFPPIVYGGLGTALGGLAKASARAGMSVGVLLVREPAPASYGQCLGGEYRQADSGQPMDLPSQVTIFQTSPLQAVEDGTRLVRNWRPDVIHLHPVQLWPVASAIRKRTGIPIVYTMHSLNLSEYEVGHEPPAILNLWQIQQEIIAEADRVIALTNGERELLASSCPSATPRVRIAGNGIDDCSLPMKSSENRGIEETPLLLYTGRFVERKGIRDLLAAVSFVLKQAPSIQVVLVGGYGSGEEMERLWLPVSLYPYRSQIHFTGWLAPPEVTRWYRAADILIVPSWYEPFGMVILEGMLHGLAIVASAVGGPKEILEHGRTGLLFPPKDVLALVEQLLLLVRDPVRRRELGAAAARDVRRRWLWPNIVERIRSIYQETHYHTACA